MEGEAWMINSLDDVTRYRITIDHYRTVKHGMDVVEEFVAKHQLETQVAGVNS
jgi:hypothetical protein